MKKTDILEVVARKLSPFILLFGFYVVSHGHLSPGGGFQGGVVLASGLILLMLTRDPREIEPLFSPRRLNLLESLAYLAFLAMGVGGIAAGAYFLGIFLPAGRAGELPSAGFILILNLVVGLKVGAGVGLICYYLFREE